VKTLFAIVLLLGLLAVSGFAQPTVTQVQNAASNALAPLPNSAIGQGSYFSIYGTGIGPSTIAYWNPYPLPTSLGGTSIAITIGTNAPVAAYPEFVSSGQINAVLPSGTSTGPGTLTVTYNGQTSAGFAINVVPRSFGIFSVNEAGSGPGIITDANYVTLSPFLTAKPGDTVILWATGLGPAPDVATEQSAAPAQTNLCATASTCPVTVWVAGQQASVAYAGRSGYTAEDQINFTVPQGVQGCYVEVAVQTGSGSSAVVGNFTSMPVDPKGATCQDADGINYADLASAVTAKGSANVLAVSMLSNYLTLNIPLLGILPWDNDTISGQIDTFSSYTLSAFQGFTLAPSVSTTTSPNCSVSPFLEYPPPPDPATAYATFLNAGNSLSIQGPNGTVSVGQDILTTGGKPVAYGGASGGDPVGGETVENLISGCPASSKNNCAPFFLTDTGWGTASWTWSIVPGTYTVTGTGASDIPSGATLSLVGALSGSIQVSTAAAGFKWTNQSSVTANAIPRDTPLTITWTGGDTNGFIDITAIASTLASGLPAANTPGILVQCIAPASTGTFTIPTYVLQSLPSTVSSTALVPPGELLVGPASGAQKITEPSGLDAAYIFYHFIEGQNVSWQ